MIILCYRKRSSSQLIFGADSGAHLTNQVGCLKVNTQMEGLAVYQPKERNTLWTEVSIFLGEDKLQKYALMPYNRGCKLLSPQNYHGNNASSLRSKALEIQSFVPSAK